MWPQPEEEEEEIKRQIETEHVLSLYFSLFLRYSITHSVKGKIKKGKGKDEKWVYQKGLASTAGTRVPPTTEYLSRKNKFRRKTCSKWELLLLFCFCCCRAVTKCSFPLSGSRQTDRHTWSQSVSQSGKREQRGNKRKKRGKVMAIKLPACLNTGGSLQ